MGHWLQFLRTFGSHLGKISRGTKALVPRFQNSTKFVFMPHYVQYIFSAASTRLRMGSRASTKWATFDVRSRS